MCDAMTTSTPMKRFCIGCCLTILLFFPRRSAAELPSTWARAEGQATTFTATGYIFAVDRSHARVFLACSKPFWAPGPNGSAQIKLWPIDVLLSLAMKGTAIKLDGKKAGFDQLAKGQDATIEYFLERSDIGSFVGVHCVAVRMNLQTPAPKKK
jgi:hypothetical protein